MAAGKGDLVIDYEIPEPDPAPVTTIAWRLGHMSVALRHAGEQPLRDGSMSFDTIEWPGTAADALAFLDDGYGKWIDGIRSLDDAGMALPVGPAEGPYAEHPYGTLVLHINREAIHHGAEVALLRDLYPRPALRRDPDDHHRHLRGVRRRLRGRRRRCFGRRMDHSCPGRASRVAVPRHLHSQLRRGGAAAGGSDRTAGDHRGGRDPSCHRGPHRRLARLLRPRCLRRQPGVGRVLLLRTSRPSQGRVAGGGRGQGVAPET